MPFVIGLPSLIRAGYREHIRKKDIHRYAKLPEYDAVWFEGQASRLGEKLFWEE